MEDRELLKTAAMAAGIGPLDFDYAQREGHGLYFGPRLPMPQGVIMAAMHTYWNPLENDGDALRLAVKIGFADGVGLSMFFADRDDPTVVVRKYDNTPGSMELVDDDPYAATRRAIVRAAAKIGKTQGA